MGKSAPPASSEALRIARMLACSPVRRASLALFGTAAVAIACSTSLALDACSLDWSVNAARVDSGGDASSMGDAKPVMNQDADVSTDASSPSDAGAPFDDGSCAMLESTTATDKANAEACIVGNIGQCTTKATDECGCQFFVSSPDAAATASYAAAVQALMASACPLGCMPVSSCPTLPVTSGCVQQGSVQSCAQ
jgi:hypothetical protein